jgi:hypothetical protein
MWHDRAKTDDSCSYSVAIATSYRDNNFQLGVPLPR